MTNQTGKDKKISVVIPCYNESKNLRALYARISKTLAGLVADYEIIFVDNSSTDNSAVIYRELASRDQKVSVIFFSRNFGNSQYGYSAGTEYASGDAVVWMEGDLQDPPEMLEKLILKWLEGYDVVYGVRPKAAGGRCMRFMRQLFYRLFRRFSYLDVPLDAGDFSILDRTVVDIFNAMPERSRFVRGLRAWVGFRHTGIEYERSERAGGVTSNPSFRRNVWWAKKFIFSFSYAPLEYISRAAFWVSLLSVPMTVIVLWIALAGRISWWAALGSIIAYGLFVLLFISLAVIGEYLAIMFEEVKARPKYIIREILNNHRE